MRTSSYHRDQCFISKSREFIEVKIRRDVDSPRGVPCWVPHADFVLNASDVEPCKDAASYEWMARASVSEE